jgi:hypothetical protein
MKILVKRTFLGDEYTIGHMYINGVYFCDTLEDPVRDTNKNGVFDNGEKKIAGDTAIPYGTYPITVNVSPKFKRELPRLSGVAEFEGVLIHRGNTAKDTAGCILVGENKVKGKVINSMPYEERIVRHCKAAIEMGEDITITIE